MISPDNGSQKAQNRRNALNEEQILCNEALESSAFDSISDDQWVALCEQAASKGRHTAEVGLGQAVPAIRASDEI
jgi:hypothetical protein